MKKILQILSVFILISVCFTKAIYGEEVPIGYSEYSTVQTNEEGEISAIQYGRKLPKVWSEWSNEKSTSLYERQREGKTDYYSYDRKDRYWDGAYAKDLFTWDFKVTSNVVYLYIDVDTYVDGSYTNYMGPPLKAYCDGELIASTGQHNYLNNWNPKINCNCRYLKVSMDSCTGSGRNKTSMVGSWATTQKTEYSHVLEWDDGNDWRFQTPYEEKYGEDSQIPTTRVVYSHPIKYKITYNLDGGEALDELIYSYTVLQEVNLPSAYKKGYEFVSWFDSSGREVKNIPKGSHRNISLTAKYQRKKPTIYAGNNHFYQENKLMAVKDVKAYENCVGKDELDGDITKNIKIDYIHYLDENRKVSNPTSLNLNKAQKIEICFSLRNSGSQVTKLIKQYYILQDYQINDYVDDDIQIYTRFIDEKYAYTLEEGSLWKSGDYKDLLEQAYKKIESEE